ncbi:hypothetical protein ACQKFG_15430 [Peribacillus sp. NPDC076916]|uniref:hypothetical protein n=1 Tax=Peribacillus sp. NPDC076916 TaxID=3390608 RepID=UPI003D044590
MQFKKKHKTRYSHSIFVYEKSNSTLYLSGHTDNYLKRNFKNMSPDWIKYRVIKFLIGGEMFEEKKYLNCRIIIFYDIGRALLV